jgi:hypothetical protein
MKHSLPVFDLESLQEIEASSRRRVEEEPDDTEARLKLAWCLLGRAFHEAGQDAMRRYIFTKVGKEIKEISEALPSAQSAEQLLKDCLHQAMVVSELSLISDEQKEAGTLRAFVSMSGGKQALQESHEESQMISSEILHAIFERFEDPNRTPFYESTLFMTENLV